MLAGTDAGTGVRGPVGCGGGFYCSVPQHGRGQGESGGTHTHTQEDTHTQRNIHANVALPFSELPLKKCPIKAS